MKDKGLTVTATEAAEYLKKPDGRVVVPDRWDVSRRNYQVSRLYCCGLHCILRRSQVWSLGPLVVQSHTAKEQPIPAPMENSGYSGKFNVGPPSKP